jgi:hypothetical protein
MRLPPQTAPVQRELLMSQCCLKDAGVGAAQDQCATLQGLAQQLCYSALYGVEF